MAQIKETHVAKFQTTKGGDIEETTFAAGTEVTVIKEWEHFFLVKDEHGHYYNLPKSVVEA
jgi:hypothetical protein